MVHSPMSLHLFEQNNRFTPLAPPASPTKSAPCALPNLEYSQPPDSSTLIHSSKNIGGIPLFFPFRNPLHSHSCPVRTPLHLPPSAGETPHSSQFVPTARSIWSAALPRRFRPTTPNHRNSTVQKFSPTARHWFSSHAPIHKRRAALSRRLRLVLDIPQSSANIPMLSV